MDDQKGTGQVSDEMKNKSAAGSAQDLYAAQASEKDERSFCISVAGHVVGIHSQYAEIYDLCRDYLCESKPEISVSVRDRDIVYERAKSEQQDIVWSEGYLETLAVYRKISEAVLDYDIFLMHGAVIGFKNVAYMFTAVSGTGKTTHIMKWLENLENAYVVNGDKPLIRITEDEAIACGTPWQGKEKLGRNCMVPLKAIVLMERGEENEIHEIPFEKALSFLLRQSYMPEDVQKMKKTLELVSNLKGRVRFYQYVFNNMKEDAFRVAYRALGNI